MPLTLLDIVLLTVMLISAILAMVRGFLREVLSIASWAAAAVLTVYAYPRLLPIAKQYLANDVAAAAVVVGGVFLGTLLIVSVITIKLSDAILDSKVGALDRTLGFMFGLARGLLIVVVAFMFFDWLVPAKSQPKWVTDAKSWPVLQGTGQWLIAMSPDVEGLWAKYKARKRDEQEPPEPNPAENRPAQRGAAAGSTGRSDDEQQGYNRADRTGMQQLIEGAGTKRR